MQRFSYREGVLLGYSPPKTLMESSSSPDIDFNDVFGGPPRRSSIQEARYSFGDNSESSGFRRTSDEMFSASREIRSSGLGEKPVFGEEEVGRRRYSKADFFDDIFGGNDTSSSPRKYDMKDPFAASSQYLLSSARLPSTAEPFGTSLPTRFSFLNKGIEPPTFGSPTRSRSSSRSQDGSSNASSHYNGTKYDNNGTETKHNSKEEGSIISKDGNATQFHFSIYKWENKASTIRANDKLEGCPSAKGWIGFETAAMESKPELHHSFRSTTDRTSSANASSRIDSTNQDGERVLSTIVPKSDSEIEHSLSKIDLSDKPGKETRKPPSKTLESLLRDEDDHERGNTTRVKGSPRNSWENGKGRVRGKVKEFIKIFNHDPLPNAVTGEMNHDTTPKSHSSRRPERGTVKVENEPNIVTMIQRDEKVHLLDIENKKPSLEVPNANHLCKSASVKNNIIEDPRDSIDDDFLIEDLTSEEKVFPEFGIDSEEIKAIDAKIQKWSDGKQGNIRSLLSTLQYVLWADSGWKPVPLVDIIEGPAVKRSYQKALLCLHPDKLQQKGAASHSKYIAEKVFDVLQEAWTHFNSLGSV